MSSAERGSRASGANSRQRASTVREVPPAVAFSAGSASTCAGGGAAQLAAAPPRPGAVTQPSSLSSTVPTAAGTPSTGLASLSFQPAVPEGDAAAGGGAPATRPAALPALPVRGAGSAASASPSAGRSALSEGASAPSGGALAPGPAAAAASHSPTGGPSVPDAGPPVPVGDDGAPLSAEAAASPFSPPASERHAAFLKLLDQKVKAGLQQRDVRSVDFSALAAEAGVVLFGADSLIVASLRANPAWALDYPAGAVTDPAKRHMRNCDFSAMASEASVPLFGADSLILADLRVGQASAFADQAGAESDPAEAEALEHRGWVVLIAQALPIIQGRLDKGTLLPGTLRKAEQAYFMYEQQLIHKVERMPVPDAEELRARSAGFGWETALFAAVTALVLLPRRGWRAEQLERVQAFVLTLLRLVPKTANLTMRLPAEEILVYRIESFMSPSRYGADFCASVLALWRSRAVADVLRARGSLQAGIAAMVTRGAEFKARQQADLAERGLRRCALPSCGKREAAVLQFRVCGHCQRGVPYCCPEHAKQHWPAHKREYEAEEVTEGEASGGARAAPA